MFVRKIDNSSNRIRLLLPIAEGSGHICLPQSIMKKNKNFRVRSEKQYEPRIVGEILHDYLENSNEPLAVAYREHTTESEEQGWKRNTHLSVNLKTFLRGDSKMKTGKDYQGILRRDVDCEEFLYDEHFTFVETVQACVEKRNPRVFRGEFVTITRRDDGSYRPNFRPMKVGADFSVEKYAAGVANELLWALEGLIENGSVEEESK